jgi:hypothetical protein
VFVVTGDIASKWMTREETIVDNPHQNLFIPHPLVDPSELNGGWFQQNGETTGNCFQLNGGKFSTDIIVMDSEF